MRSRRDLPDEHYEYFPQGRTWAVYHFKRTASGWEGTKVDTFLTKEEARRETYRLNGWNDGQMKNERIKE